MGNWCIDPRFLDLAKVGGECSASRHGRFTPRGKNHQCPLDVMQGGPQSRSGNKPSGFYTESPPKSHTGLSTTGLWQLVLACVKDSSTLQVTIELHGLSPRANYTDRATTACRRSDCQLLRIEGCHVVIVTDPYGRILGFLDRSRYFSIK
jgi:hypothetical protein